MKKFNIVMLVLFMAGLLAVLPMYAAAQYGSSPSHSSSSSSQMNNEKSSMREFHSFNTSDLIGKTVKNKNGVELGKVEDVTLSHDGMATFVILSRGDTMGAGAKYVPVPFKTFTSSWTNMARLRMDSDLISTLSKAKLDAAPSFGNKEELSQRTMHEKVCRFYGPGACPHIM